MIVGEIHQFVVLDRGKEECLKGNPVKRSM